MKPQFGTPILNMPMTSSVYAEIYARLRTPFRVWCLPPAMPLLSLFMQRGVRIRSTGGHNSVICQRRREASATSLFASHEV